LENYNMFYQLLLVRDVLCSDHTLEIRYLCYEFNLFGRVRNNL